MTTNRIPDNLKTPPASQPTMRRPTIDRDTVMETVTDPRLEPHFFLAGLLTLTALLAVILFVFFPNF